MTRHNLDEHLRWLLRAKPSVPPSETNLPPATASFGSVGASQAPDASIPVTQVPSPQRRPEPHQPVAETRPDNDMAKLRVAPGSAGRSQLVSRASREPERTPSMGSRSHLDTRIQQAAPLAKPLFSRQTSTTAQRNVTFPADVEIMDLTDGGGLRDEPIMGRAGRKRKSEDFEADTDVGRSDTRAIRRRPEAAAASGGFATIDEDEPSEPPPPYSTVAPNPAVPSRAPRLSPHIAAGPSKRTLAGASRRVMPDSEDEDDEDMIVNFAEPRHRPNSSKKVTPQLERRTRTPDVQPARVQDSPLKQKSSCTQPDSSVDRAVIPHSRVGALSDKRSIETPAPKAEALTPIAPSTLAQTPRVPAHTAEDGIVLQALLNCSEKALHHIEEILHTKADSASDAAVEAIEEDREDADKLEAACDDLRLRLASVQALQGKKQQYQSAIEEKEQKRVAMRAALKSGERKAEARADLEAFKSKLLQVEQDCLVAIRPCQSDLAHLLQETNGTEQAGGYRKVAVQSTQAFPPVMAKAPAPAFPSSSRVAQTQVCRNEPAPMVTDRSYSGVDTTAMDIDTYFSPKRQAKPVQQQKPPAKSPPLQRYDDFDDYQLVQEEDEPPRSELFSNRMGSPPPPFEEEPEDFGMDDDQDMLDFANDIENHRPYEQPYSERPSRPAFTETSGNSQAKSNRASASKAKSRPSKPTDEDRETEMLFSHPWSDDVKAIARTRFKFKGFRKNQVQAINATLAGKDCFVLMPTGGGKSFCYQLPSLLTSGRTRGVTIVVSPLVSLMEDQVDHLRRLNIDAFLLNGSTSKEDKSDIYSRLSSRRAQESIQLLYVTPEMLSKSEVIISIFDKMYNNGQLARLVIDEAHCVSQWGHDFRPDYKQLGDVRRKYPRVPLMALTATATENVKVDVIHNLGIDGCEVYTQSFNRENLYYEVRQKGKGKEDLDAIATLIKDKYRKQTGIIYCFSRRDCEKMAQDLRQQHQIKAQHFHAGMEPDEKRDVQHGWQAGRHHVIVATIAFGMGIDKGNVRFVIHHTIPKSLEGYYQETGRAGRDGQDSSCYLFYGYRDATKIRKMIDDGDGSHEQKGRLRLMLKKMVQFCENKTDCRRVQVLAYFNEPFKKEQCQGQCDNCNSTSVFETKDFTDYAKEAVALVKALKEDKVTILHCIDVFRGATIKKVKDKNHHELDQFGAGRDLDQGDIERLFYSLMTEEAIREDNVLNKKSGFHVAYAVPGGNANNFLHGRQRLQLQIRVDKTPRAASKAPAKRKSKDVAAPEKTKRAKKTAGSMAPPDLPFSTNVSSPVQGASKRSKAKAQAASTRNTDLHPNGYARDSFIVGDDEHDGSYNNDDSDSDNAFEPVRVAGVPSKRTLNKRREVGPPIITDATMDSLDPIHRDFVESFVDRAKKTSQTLVVNKNLRNAPFTDTMLRAMAIHWTETDEQILASVRGADAEKVRLYAKPFIKIVKDVHQHYIEAMGGFEEFNELDDETDGAPTNAHTRNEIDIIDVSSDDEPEDYGSWIGDDDDEQGEDSAYFRDPKNQQSAPATSGAALMQNFAYSTQNGRSQAETQPAGGAKGGRKKSEGSKDAEAAKRKKFYAKKTAIANKGGGGSYGGGRGGARQGKGPSRRSGGGSGAGGRGAGGGYGRSGPSGIGMMPT